MQGAKILIVSASIQTALNLKTPMISRASARALNARLLFTARNKNPNLSCWPSVVIVTTHDYLDRITFFCASIKC